MKKRLIIGLLCTSFIALIAVLLQKEANAVSCVNPYLHKTYLVYGIEKHSCVKCSTGSGEFDWGLWGISKKSVKGGLGLQVEFFGTAGDTCDAPVVAPDGTVTFDPDCLIDGQLFCCNGGGQCGGEQGQPFQSESLSAQAVLKSEDCDTTGKCRETLILNLDPNEIKLECQNRNWGGTFTPEEMYVQSCTCDAGFDVNGACCASSVPDGSACGTGNLGTPSCNVQHCFLDLDFAGYQPGMHLDYDCSLPVP